MCSDWSQDLFGLKKVFKFICTLLTILLLFQESFNFLVTKPKVTSNAEKDLDITDLPEVVICLEPGLNTAVVGKYGYKEHYDMGSVDGKKFVGWNGNENVTKSSNEIFEEALIVKTQHINETKFITWASYRDQKQDYFPIAVRLRTLSFPYGRCFSISPTSLQENVSSTINTLYLTFNESVFDKYLDFSAMIYFMDETSSLKIYPDDMTGDPLQMSMNENQKFTYEAKISRRQHVPSDPHLKCGEYTLKNSYNDCAKDNLFLFFHDILGCQ